MKAQNYPTFLEKFFMPRLICSLIGLAALLVWNSEVGAQTLAGTSTAALTQDTQWETSIAAFTAADRKHAPPPGGVVFIGSSSIRLWSDLESQFGNTAIILKRGFGGARMADCTRYLDRVVLPYKPRLILVYAGDNDLAEGKQPQDVLEHFTKFVERIHQALPATRIAFISIKPSPARVSWLANIRETNELIRQFAVAGENLDFIDVFTLMLNSAGYPRDELFLADALHLNSAGYALWKSVIGPHVR